jgi:hypothetical protein
MLFVDYQILVLQEYERKKAASDLSHRMSRLTPAKFKEECEVVCNQRYDRKDEKTLEEFFGTGGDKMAILQAIKRCDTDRFRPLVNFLRGKTRFPDEKNIELLAWLIDFRPRPHVIGGKNSGIEPDISEKAGLTEEVVQIGKKEMPAPGTTAKTIAGFGKGKIIVAGMILAGAIAGVYWAWSRSSTAAMTGPQACMFWAGDHYKQIPCSQKLGDTPVVALDPEKLNFFKKITRPDTITDNSIGRLWYVRFNGNYEYYTSGGFHPIDPRLQLRPLTDYIYKKHTHPSDDTAQGSK